MIGEGFLISGESDPHPYRQAGITRLSVAVIERAIRDAQLVEVGHRVAVCRLERWSDRERRHIIGARRWLMDPDNAVFRMWASGAGMEATHISESVERRITWTERLEAAAREEVGVPSRHQRWPSTSWPFRRVGDDRALELKESGVSN
jgi:hypothetical protein